MIWSSEPTSSMAQYVWPLQVEDWAVSPLMKLFEIEIPLLASDPNE